MWLDRVEMAARLRFLCVGLLLILNVGLSRSADKVKAVLPYSQQFAPNCFFSSNVTNPDLLKSADCPPSGPPSQDDVLFLCDSFLNATKYLCQVKELKVIVGNVTDEDGKNFNKTCKNLVELKKNANYEKVVKIFNEIGKLTEEKYCKQICEKNSLLCLFILGEALAISSISGTPSPTSTVPALTTPVIKAEITSEKSDALPEDSKPDNAVKETAVMKKQNKDTEKTKESEGSKKVTDVAVESKSSTKEGKTSDKEEKKKDETAGTEKVPEKVPDFNTPVENVKLGKDTEDPLVTIDKPAQVGTNTAKEPTEEEIKEVKDDDSTKTKGDDKAPSVKVPTAIKNPGKQDLVSGGGDAEVDGDELTGGNEEQYQDNPEDKGSNNAMYNLDDEDGGLLPHKEKNVVSVKHTTVGFDGDDGNSHFFMYFITVVGLGAVLYILFHNKKKILALILEGRNNRSRRPNSSQYRKLDNNVDEVIVSSTKKASVGNIIY